MSVLGGAVETAPVSDLHAVGSTDPADFAVPAGREEEWRFTPLRRLRGLHADAPFADGGVTGAGGHQGGVLVQGAQPAQRGEPPLLLAAAGDLEVLRVGRAEGMEIRNRGGFDRP